MEQALNDLTKKVKFLYIEREQQGAQQSQAIKVQNIECDDPRDRIRAPVKERKTIIYECPKFLGIKHTPPSLNKSATLAVRKNNAALYGIQMALANLTSIIDDYVQRKLKSPNTKIQGNEDLEFAHTMRELLSNVALSITQNRIDNLHKSMELPGRLDALLAVKNPTARSRRNERSHFCLRQQTAFGTTSAITQTPHNATPNTVNNNQTTQRTTRYVLSSLSQTHRQQVGQEHSREGIQDSAQKSESREAKGFDKKKLYKKVISYGPPLTLHPHRYKREMSKEASEAITKEVAALLAKNAIEQSNIYYTKKDRKPTSSPGPPKAQQLCPRDNVGCSPPWLANAEDNFGIKKQFLEESKIMGCHDDSEQSSNSKLRILETESAKMKRSIISIRGSRNENFCQCQKHSMGNSFWIPVLFRIVISIDSISPHKHQGIISSYIQKYYKSSLRTEIWGNYLSQIARSLKETVVSLRIIKTDCSNGMVSINRDIHKTEQNICPYDVDLFATRQNKKLSKYYSWYQDSQSVGTNALGHSWLQYNSPYCCPPRAHTNTGVGDYARPKKRQISATQKQILVADGMKNQWRALQQEDLTGLALDLITANTISIFIKRKLKQSTIKAYKSALLQLATDKERVGKKKCFIEFMKFLNELDLIKVTNNFINIKPIINHFKILGPTNNLNTKELTAKTCWLIAVCGFLRASDIHRVDDERTEISNNSIKLIICAPKEKCKSSLIERLVEIKAHSDEILCPVIAYKIYKQRIAKFSCLRPHVNNKNLIVIHLFRSTKDFNKPLTKGITPMARAIGATIAARTGILTDAILTQANWSSYYMFSSYYKLSNDSYSNIT
ncbi:hypothetical protein BB561_001700 [Smittium simulii]|uniref:Uncharacterized protein n=1 Tax=Smittium simulii TaxID=133385 RepID=A0A2T9YTL1_9FUNG|nr:hypothetical protein BB561_001700 [Smittium simulii]